MTNDCASGYGLCGGVVLLEVLDFVENELDKFYDSRKDVSYHVQ